MRGECESCVESRDGSEELKTLALISFPSWIPLSCGLYREWLVLAPHPPFFVDQNMLWGVAHAWGLADNLLSPAANFFCSVIII